MQPCSKCDGTGKLITEKPVDLQHMEKVEEDCDLCEGTGWLPEDQTPEILKRLDRIIELLEALREAQHGA